MPARDFWKQPHSPLSDLGLTAAEYAALRAWMTTTTPDTIDALWTFIGRNADTGCRVPAGTALAQDRLLQVLLARADAERREQTGPQAWNPVGRLIKRHWLEIVALAAAAFIIIAVARIAGAQAGWWAAGLAPRVVAAHAIAPGVTITQDDLTVAYLPKSDTPNAPRDEVIGRRVARPIAAGSIVERGALQAQQVVARWAISPGSRLREQDLRLGWADEAAGAFTDTKKPVGMCAAEPIAANAVVSASALVTCP